MFQKRSTNSGLMIFLCVHIVAAIFANVAFVKTRKREKGTSLSVF